MSKVNEKNLGSDIIELACVWNNLSDEMQKLIAIAIGGGQDQNGISTMLSEISELDKDGFMEYATERLLNFNNFVREGVEKIKEIDESLTDLKKK